MHTASLHVRLETDAYYDTILLLLRVDVMYRYLTNYARHTRRPNLAHPRPTQIAHPPNFSLSFPHNAGNTPDFSSASYKKYGAGRHGRIQKFTRAG